MNHSAPSFNQIITRHITKGLSVCLFILYSVDSVWADVPAFPGAEGYGAASVGGRGGVVYEVTTLNPAGTGSLGAAISAAGPRTVVFRVAGTITGNFNIKNDKITIAGQTAPGDGICIKGNVSLNANDVIIRYIRVRLDPAVDADAIGGRYKKNIILDHVSASWSSDEVMSLYHNEYVTIQWCMITEGCAKIVDGVNIGHRFAGIWGNNYSTYHHNLIAHCDSRNPRWASGCQYSDYRNNVLYNWGYQSCYGGGAIQTDLPQFGFSTINMVANYYKYGPATGSKYRIAQPSEDNGPGSWYVADNHVDGYPSVTANNWLGIDGSSYIKLSAPWEAMPVNQQTPADAYNAVLARAGCSKPNRDSVDTRIIEEVRTRTATYGNHGIITYPSDVGGWPTLNSGIPPADSDHDGMADFWEVALGLNPTNAVDRNYNTLSSDFTNLELYLDSLVSEEDTAAPMPNPMTWAAVPQGVNSDSISMVATTSIDTSGVEYYFDCIAGGGHDSGWQDSASYTDSGLTSNTAYSYRVIARDKSPNQNETGWSMEASAMTMRYECLTPLKSDFNADCKVDIMDYASIVNIWGAEPVTSTNLVSNGEFVLSISSWVFSEVTGAGGVMIAEFDEATGNPAGSARVGADNAAATNGHRFYQCVPVTVGTSYTLSGEWSGNITGLITSPAGGSLRNWAEVFVGFETSTAPAEWTSLAIVYKKAYGAGLTNTTTGVWGWEPLSSSPNGMTAPDGGVFTATAPYMVVAFNLGGRAGSGSTQIWVDNIRVIQTLPCAGIDLNDDCQLDLLDMAVFVESWLDCHRVPLSECLQ